MIEYWLTTIIFLFGSLGVLLIGFDLLSKNITKLFHKGLKSLFNKTSKSKLLGVGIGTATTAIMQSSAATTIMVVGFVNTGLMSLSQATSIIMGANIGTTITAQLASLSSFDFGSYAIILAGIGVFINMFTSNEKIKTLGNSLSGFGLLFLGLKCINLSLDMEYLGSPLIKDSIAVLLTNINGWYAPILLFVIGAILTAFCHSSALITTIIITVAGTGIYIGAGADATCLNNNVLFLILGTNVGTCVTAMISSVGATTNAKRASFIHLLFNLLGAILFIIILTIFPSFMENTLVKMFPDNPAVEIAMFHTGFNLICTFVFLPFTSIIVKISETIIKDKVDTTYDTKYLDERLLSSPSIATHQVRREISLMYEQSFDTLMTSLKGLLEKTTSYQESIINTNKILEKKNKLVIEYMIKISGNKLTLDDECTISSFYKTLHDVIRIGEIGDNIKKYTTNLIDFDLELSQESIEQVTTLKDKIEQLFNLTLDTFANKNVLNIKQIDALEDDIDALRKKLIDDHYERLNKGKCEPEKNAIYVNLVNNLERAADHMTYIAHSLTDTI